MNVAGNDYSNNDHVALADDLRTLAGMGKRIVPVSLVVDALLGDAPRAEVADAVAISFDDGSWFDWHDIEHPDHGQQRSLAGALRDFSRESGAQVHATSFVIVSPNARAELDRTCMIGRGWWGDEWWPQAASEGILAIESHSWDHNHATLRHTAQHEQRKGTFKTIDTYADANAEIRQASAWLDRRLPGCRTTLFAYPYGECNDYLVDDYLPNRVGEHRLRAAFTTEPRRVESTSNRWRLPRFVCGEHWRSTSELQQLVRDGLS